LVETTVMGFDRLKFWVDHPAPDIPVSQIRRHCRKLKVRECSSRPFHPAWQTEIDILQPGCEALRQLEIIVGTRHRVQLRYAELAIDWLVRDVKAAVELQAFFLNHLRVPYLRHDVRVEEGTAYFGPRADDEGQKRERNLVLYADRPSKLWDAGSGPDSPCCHLEYRFQGVHVLAQHGLLSLAGCVGFDHLDFWRRHLLLFHLPSKRELGRWINPACADVSPTALAKRADRFLGRYMHEDMFVLQDCYLDNRQIDKILEPLSSQPFLRKATA
jgi:hypothetical protein